uniref:Uncharacterized protein n=1 Tax=Timema cristinae TaxID=61476 RepID=A0A7R9D8C7_TIMCR|nr:unnamed protein product [Timema cristinae]
MDAEQADVSAPSHSIISFVCTVTCLRIRQCGRKYNFLRIMEMENGPMDTKSMFESSISSHLKMLKNTVSNQSTSKEDIIIPKRIHRGPTDILREKSWWNDRVKKVVEEKNKALRIKEQSNKRVLLKPGGIGCKYGQKYWNEMWK